LGRRGPRSRSFILNCVASLDPQEDWTIEDASEAGLVDVSASIPKSKDLRAAWWKIDHQEKTGACVGFATAAGVLRWHYVRSGLIQKSQNQRPSPRFIWMANKETDEITSYPTTFLDNEGTQTKRALGVARRYGCVSDNILPMNGRLSRLRSAAFYALAARHRLTSYHNLGRNPDDWRRWVATTGPILTRLDVDRTWDGATDNRGKLTTYESATVRGGHAVCLVGFTTKHFIVRNSWGSSWGDRGFAYASDAYAQDAFTEAYGAVI